MIHIVISDENIEGVFSTIEKAQEAIDSGYLNGSIVSWKLDLPVHKIPALEEGWRYWFVWFDNNGKITNHFDIPKHDSYVKLTCGARWAVRQTNKETSVEIFANGLENAIKLANEKRIFALNNPGLAHFKSEHVTIHLGANQ